MQNTELAMNSSHQPIFEDVDQLKKIVIGIVSAMASDYGDVFKRTFSNEEEVRNLKRRLYVKLKGLPVDCIVDGYESCIADTPKFCPTIPDIVKHVLQSVKNKKNIIENQLQSEAIAALPAPTITAQPERVSEMLGEAMQTPIGDEAARLKRLAEKLQMNDALIAVDKARGLIAKGPDWNGHSCAIGFCSNPGVLAHGKGGNFYCSEHFTH